MDDMLALTFGVTRLRAAIVDSTGLRSPVVNAVLGTGAGNPADAAKHAISRLGAPSDMWAVAAIEPTPGDPRRARPGGTRSGDSSVHGVSSRRLTAHLNRPVIVDEEHHIAAAAEAWFGPGANHRSVAYLRVGPRPQYSVVLHRQVASTNNALTQAMVSLQPPSQIDGAEVIRTACHAAIAIVEDHRPDMLIMGGASDRLVERTLDRLREIQRRRGPSLPDVELSPATLGADAALRGCAIWPTASGQFGSLPSRRTSRPLPQW